MGRLLFPVSFSSFPFTSPLLSPLLWNQNEVGAIWDAMLECSLITPYYALASVLTFMRLTAISQNHSKDIFFFFRLIDKLNHWAVFQEVTLHEEPVFTTPQVPDTTYKNCYWIGHLFFSPYLLPCFIQMLQWESGTLNSPPKNPDRVHELLHVSTLPLRKLGIHGIKFPRAAIMTWHITLWKLLWNYRIKDILMFFWYYKHC